MLRVWPRSGRLAVTNSLKVRSFGQMSITYDIDEEDEYVEFDDNADEK